MTGTLRYLRVLLLTVGAACLFFGGSTTAYADDEGGGHGGKANKVTFVSNGTGKETSGGAPGCQFSGQCTVQSSGTAVVAAGSYVFPAAFTSSLTIDYGRAVVTPTNYCAPASGTVTLTSALTPADSIHKTESGAVCAGNQTGAPHTFIGTYPITGGTGRLAGASGSGTTVVQDNGLGVILVANETGTIRYSGAQGGNGGDNGPAGDEHGRHQGGD